MKPAPNTTLSRVFRGIYTPRQRETLGSSGNLNRNLRKEANLPAYRHPLARTMARKAREKDNT